MEDNENIKLKCVDCNNLITDHEDLECCNECYNSAKSDEKDHYWDCKCVIHR